MGKDSLIKSTSKKKAPARKKGAPAKKAAAAPKAKAAAKAAVKPKAAPKPPAKAAPKPPAKAAPKPPAKAAPKPPAPEAPPVKAKKAAPEPKKKPVSVKDLVHQKFPVWKPAKAFTVAPDKAYLKDFVAPPIVSGTGDAARQIKALLLKKFDVAEMKAAAEKAAVEKAAAEKAAAEKAPEARAPAPTHVPPVDTDFDDPVDKTMKYFMACILVLIGLVIGASAMNSSDYFIETGDGSVEIWQGRFAPMGKKLLISLPGVQLTEPVKETYSRSEVSPIVFHYYIEKADSLLDVPGMPDFEGIQAYLGKAMAYATTSELAELANARAKNIDLMILMYKAEVASSRGTLADLETARGLLTQAARLNPDDQRKSMISQKLASLSASIEALKSKQQKEAGEAEATEASTHKK